LAPPLWEEIGVRLRVTLYKEQIGPVVIDPIDQAILDVLGSAEGCGTSEIAEKIKRSPRATRTRLAKLVARGLVREIGQGPKDPKRRYFKAV
jgi:DNA-binding MarR family transcriptional regulator